MTILDLNLHISYLLAASIYATVHAVKTIQNKLGMLIIVILFFYSESISEQRRVL